MNNKLLKISLHYITNFKPKLELFKQNKLLFKGIRDTNNQILCRNLFLFFLFLKTITKQKQSNVTIFIKPKKQQHFTVLRAPYRYKLGRNQYGVSRYFIVATFCLCLLRDIKSSNINHIIYFIKLCKQFYPWFETNICFQHRCVLFLTFKYANWFKLLNYK